jgi:NAD(P)H-nitrite reductase large subunit
MDPDDELCLCFHVTKRKVVNYLRIERPRSAAQLANCYGAGTGCGWCRPYLRMLFEMYSSAGGTESEFPDASAYARGRSEYVRAGKGQPPAGATPIDELP